MYIPQEGVNGNYPSKKELCFTAFLCDKVRKTSLEKTGETGGKRVLP